MRIGGIIAEYNPFHSGHAYHIAATKRMGISHLVVAMSGNYVQRGEVACFSKWARARAAIENGADLVVELQTPLATAPAGDFAYAGVDLLHRLGVQLLSFGSECGDVDLLRQTLRLCVMAEQNEAFQKALEQGVGHPKAREQALTELVGGSYIDIMRAPNNLLALEYLRAIDRIEPLIEARTVTRFGVAHDAKAANQSFASASYLRQLLKAEGVDALSPYLPNSAYRIFKSEVLGGKAVTNTNTMDLLLLAKLRSTTAEQIQQIDGVCEGLENRIRKETVTCKTIEECVDAVCSKRYTKARVRRILLHLLLQQKQNVFGKTAQYIRILAMNEKGKEIIRSAKKAGIPMSPKFADLAQKDLSQALFEAKATDLYSLCSETIQPVGREYTEPVIVYQDE